MDTMTPRVLILGVTCTQQHFTYTQRHLTHTQQHFQVELQQQPLSSILHCYSCSYIPPLSIHPHLHTHTHTHSLSLSLSHTHTHSLVTTTETMLDSFYSTITYYSTWNHLKELVLVPYQRVPRTKSPVIKIKSGTTTILLTNQDDTKTGKTSRATSQTSKTPQAGTSKASSSVSHSKTVDSTTEPGAKTPSFKEVKHSKSSSEPTSTKIGSNLQHKQIIEEVSVAKEVEEYRLKEVYFGQSKKPREYRTSSIRYSVGQVVRHREDEYVGVIIGWDRVAQVSV